MNDIVTTKIFIAIGTFFISFISAAAPLKIIHLDDNIFSIGNLFSSGVMLAAGLVHQLSDSTEALEGVVGDFPLATFIAGLTFCLFLIMEEYLHTQFDDSPFEHQHKDKVNENENLVHNADDKKNNNHSHERSKLLLSNTEYNDNDDGSEVFARMNRGKERKASYAGPTSASIRVSTKNGCDTGIEINTRQSSANIFDTMRNESFSYEHPVHYHDEHLAEHARGSLLSSVILLVALSIHSIFEGLAIGVSSNITEVTSITAAVLAHKAFAGYALGSAMIASSMKELQFFILCFVFGICSIVGVFFGIMLQGTVDPDNSVPIGVIQAMVAGTFLYVSIVEIAMKELMTHRGATEGDGEDSAAMNVWAARKLVALLLGYLMMSMLAIWV